MLKNRVEWTDYVKENFYEPADEKLIRFVIKEILHTYPNELAKWDVFRFDCGLSLTQNVRHTNGNLTPDTFILAKEKVLTNSDKLKNQIAIWNKDFPTLNTHVYQSLDEAILDRNCVQVLDLSGKKMTSIPNIINRFPHLKELYLNDNEISELPPELFDCEHLTTLHLNDNVLREIPMKIGKLKRLQDLDLGNNLINEFEPNLFLLNRLISLNLSKNPISTYSFPDEVGNLKWLQTLDISGVSVDCLPGVLTSLEFLEQVIVNESCFALKSRECSEVLGTLNFVKVPD